MTSEYFCQPILSLRAAVTVCAIFVCDCVTSPVSSSPFFHFLLCPIVSFSFFSWHKWEGSKNLQTLNRIKRKRDTAIQRISSLSSLSECFCYRQARRCRRTSPSRPPRWAPSCWWPLSHTAAARPQSPGASTKSLSQSEEVCEEARAQSTYRNGEKKYRKCDYFSVARLYFLSVSLVTCSVSFSNPSAV